MRKQCKQWQTLFSWAPKSLQMITAAMKLKDTCSLEERLWPTRWYIKKQRHYFANKGPSSQSYGFSSSHVRMWKLDHKKKPRKQKTECWRIDGFELWCWRRLLRVPWTVRRSNLSILKEISPEYSLEGLMLRLKLQYFGHRMQTANWLEKALMLGKIEGRRRRGQQRHGWIASLPQWTWVWASSRRRWRTGKPGMLQSMGLQSWTWLSDWTTSSKEGEREFETSGSWGDMDFTCVGIAAVEVMTVSMYEPASSIPCL